MARKVVFDTNVLISGYLWKGLARRALEKVRSREWALLISNDAIDELIRVLAYDKFGLKPEEIEPIVRDLTEISEFVEVRTQIQIIEDDPTDNIFLDIEQVKAILAASDLIASWQVLLPSSHSRRERRGKGRASGAVRR